MSVLTSRDNPKVKRWAKLGQDPRYRRSEKRALIEGPHLLAAALEQGHKLIALLATQEGAADPEIAGLIAGSGVPPVFLSRAVFKHVVDAESPPGLAAEIAIPAYDAKAASRVVFLEGVQDPSNVGAVIRSAAAFGVERMILDRACADPWSPKALRAGMGGHFGVSIAVVDELHAVLESFPGKLVCTVPRGGAVLRDASLEGSIGWIFGGEGRGVSEATIGRATLRLTIPMAPSMESLNVAAAAAICLYETFGKRGRDPFPRKGS